MIRFLWVCLCLKEILDVYFFRINTPRKEGGLGKMNIPLLADKSCKVSKDYGVYKEDEGLTFRYDYLSLDVFFGE